MMSINKKYFNRLAAQDVLMPVQVKPSIPTPDGGNNHCRSVFFYINQLNSTREIMQFLVYGFGDFKNSLERFCNNAHGDHFTMLIVSLERLVCIIEYIVTMIPLTTNSALVDKFLSVIINAIEPIINQGLYSEEGQKGARALCMVLPHAIALADRSVEYWEELFNAISLTPSLNPQPQPIVCPKPTREAAEALLDGVLGTTGQVLSDDAREELIMAILAIMVGGATLAAVIAALFASGVAAAEIGVMALYGFALAIWAAIEDWCSDDDEEIKDAPYTVEV